MISIDEEDLMTVSVNPEGDYTAKAQKDAFPGARPATVTADPQRDGDTQARKTTPLPFGLPFGNTVTRLPENYSTDDANEDALGGEFGEAGVAGTGASAQGAESPEHVDSQDGGPVRSYTDPDPLPAALQGVDTVDHVGVAGESEAPYVPVAGTEDPEHKQH